MVSDVVKRPKVVGAPDAATFCADAVRTLTIGVGEGCKSAPAVNHRYRLLEPPNSDFARAILSLACATYVSGRFLGIQRGFVLGKPPPRRS